MTIADGSAAPGPLPLPADAPPLPGKSLPPTIPPPAPVDVPLWPDDLLPLSNPPPVPAMPTPPGTAKAPDVPGEVPEPSTVLLVGADDSLGGKGTAGCSGCDVARSRAGERVRADAAAGAAVLLGAWLCASFEVCGKTSILRTSTGCLMSCRDTNRNCHNSSAWITRDMSNGHCRRESIMRQCRRNADDRRGPTLIERRDITSSDRCRPRNLYSTFHYQTKRCSVSKPVALPL